eukprot:TRINITY_DN1958_c0_g1_i2.p1 TRINITY_DN1958_c0_g1~~TRINITY_DN1958_c0_g1_i2.p1  ORF type:complete len:259 (+),score=114.32 TRINITY_DN1958_c0_g1_i2:97-873(+)
MFSGVKGKLLGKAEEVLGVDLDGDGQTGCESRELMVKRAFTEALEEGVVSAVSVASRSGGFNDNPRVRIPWPEELGGPVEAAVQRFLPDYYEGFVTKLNAAAERSADCARDVLVHTIKGLDLSKALDLILSDNPIACTDHFRSTSWSPLYSGMKGIVETALGECRVMAMWEDVTGAYNKIPGTAKSIGNLPDELNTDIADYATNKAITGLLVFIGDKEKCIRDNPLIAASKRVQKVFSHDFLASVRERGLENTELEEE